jgi:addiction module HigA family antidote
MGKLPPIHPGEVLLEEFMRPLGLSQRRVAEDLHVPVSRIRRIVRSKGRISAETALRLARYFGASAALWLRLQVRYDLEVAKDRLAKSISRYPLPHPRARQALKRDRS